MQPVLIHQLPQARALPCPACLRRGMTDAAERPRAARPTIRDDHEGRRVAASLGGPATPTSLSAKPRRSAGNRRAERDCLRRRRPSSALGGPAGAPAPSEPITAQVQRAH
jgi:hypothetical protein